jgi:hypothetical protein
VLITATENEEPEGYVYPTLVLGKQDIGENPVPGNTPLVLPSSLKHVGVQPPAFCEKGKHNEEDFARPLDRCISHRAPGRTLRSKLEGLLVELEQSEIRARDRSDRGQHEEPSRTVSYRGR